MSWDVDCQLTFHLLGGLSGGLSPAGLFWNAIHGSRSSAIRVAWACHCRLLCRLHLTTSRTWHSSLITSFLTRSLLAFPRMLLRMFISTTRSLLLVLVVSSQASIPSNHDWPKASLVDLVLAVNTHILICPYHLSQASCYCGCLVDLTPQVIYCIVVIRYIHAHVLKLGYLLDSLIFDYEFTSYGFSALSFSF